MIEVSPIPVVRLIVPVILAETRSARRRRLIRLHRVLQKAALAEIQLCIQEPFDLSSSMEINGGVSHGSASVIGRRREMEDAIRVEFDFARRSDSGSFLYAGVFDGHGGAEVAEACRSRLHRILKGEICGAADGVLDWESLMCTGFEKMDGEVGGRCGGDVAEEKTVGSTAVVAVVGKEEIVVANCGDSRTVVCRNGKAVALTVDHKPDRPDELARIEAAGGKVVNWNGHRVSGVLSTSRSIGDHYLRPFVIPKPEVKICNRTVEDEFLILASDGLWDVISNDEACRVARRRLNGKPEREARCSAAATVLVELAMARGSYDNISVVVAEMNRPRSKQRSTVCR